MKEILKIRCHIYILMKKVIILRKVLVTMKSFPGSSLFNNTSARHKRHKSNTRATWTTRVLHKRHECDTSVTRVKNFDFDDDTSHNIFSHPYISSRILNSLAGCVTELCASYFYWFFFFILAFFDILASLLISRVFWSGFSDRWESPAWAFPEQLSNLIM